MAHLFVLFPDELVTCSTVTIVRNDWRHISWGQGKRLRQYDRLAGTGIDACGR